MLGGFSLCQPAVQTSIRNGHTSRYTVATDCVSAVKLAVAPLAERIPVGSVAAPAARPPALRFLVVGAARFVAQLVPGLLVADLEIGAFLQIATGDHRGAVAVVSGFLGVAALLEGQDDPAAHCRWVDVWSGGFDSCTGVPSFGSMEQSLCGAA